MKLAFENRAFLLAILAALPASITAYVFIYHSDLSSITKWAIVTVITASWLAVSWWFRQHLQYRLRTVSSLLAGFRDGDYTTKGRGARQGDALGEVSTLKLGELLWLPLIR